jgi:galactokinase
MVNDILTIYLNKFGHSPSLHMRAPGRVNLLGEHVDYNQGVVLPMAIDRQVDLFAAPNTNNTLNLYALDLDQSVSIRLDRLSQKTNLSGEPLDSWALYPAGIAWALQENNFTPSGIDVLYYSNVPIGAGLSSSAAVEVGFAGIWNQLNDWEIENLQLAQIAQKAENDYVGVNCGLMDQFASACGVAGHALYFDTRNLSWETAPLPPETVVVIADSGIRRELSDSAYNERRASCEQAVKLLQQYMPDIKSLRDVETTEFMAYKPYLPELVSRRAEHVVKEIARVKSAYNALLRNDPAIFGALMYAGHASLRDLYEVSTPELDTLVELTRHIPGCYGARLTGAGFGGCTVNLVEQKQAEVFIQSLQAGYLQKTGLQCQVYICHASQGVSVCN